MYLQVKKPAFGFIHLALPDQAIMKGANGSGVRPRGCCALLTPFFPRSFLEVFLYCTLLEDACPTDNTNSG